MRKKMEPLQSLRCSNCGKNSEYTQDELDEVFPYSRERLICKNCGHTLSVCSGFFG